MSTGLGSLKYGTFGHDIGSRSHVFNSICHLKRPAMIEHGIVNFLFSCVVLCVQSSLPKDVNAYLK